MSAAAEKVFEQHFRCPFCRKTHAARIKRRVPEGSWGERWYVGCLNCEDGGASGKAYLRQLAEAVGCKPIDLLQRADEVLAELLVRKRSRSNSTGAAAPLPLRPQIEQWASALDGAPLRYLTRKRGISSTVVRANSVGLDTRPSTPRLTFPMFDGLGRLVAMKYRQPRPGAQMLAPSGKGRAWPLYPWPKPASREPLVVCAGELDALCALSHGLDACSVTLGAGHWEQAWTLAVQRRLVLVCFDNGERVQARRIWRLLAGSGVSVQLVSLRKLGLEEPKGDLSDYLLAGGDPSALLTRRRRT